MQWQYRTILFEFQKDGLLGDKYIDDEEVEALLNEQGDRGWELVNVAMIQEGLLAFCKRPSTVTVEKEDKPPAAATSNLRTDQEPVSAEKLKEMEREHIQHLEKQRRETMSAIDRDVVGDIKIS